MAEETPLISCLCVTRDRPEFMPWLLWNFRKQTYENKELIVVDGSDPWDPLNTPLVGKLVHAPRINIPDGRNLAMAEARGPIFAWFDDDDWQHPRRLELIAQRLEAGDAVAVSSMDSWFLDLRRRYAKPFRADTPLFNSMGFYRSGAPTFADKPEVAEDLPWLREFMRDRQVALIDEVLSFWLCHDKNRINTAQKWAGNWWQVEQDERGKPQKRVRNIDHLRSRIGPGDWADTDVQLSALRQRLGY